MTKEEIKQLNDLLDKMLFECELPDDVPYWRIEGGVTHIKKYLRSLVNENNNNDIYD